jgi:hypothetical protein
MIFCSVPLKIDEIPVLESKVQNALANEGFFKENPYASFSLASANMPSSASVKYIPNMPIRRGWVQRFISNTVGHLWKGFKSTCSIIYGRDGHTPYLHCVRLYPLTSVKNPKTDIASLRSVLEVERPVIQVEVEADGQTNTNGKVLHEVLG